MMTNDLWKKMRADMPVSAKYAYFDHAAVAPLSGPAQRAMAKWLDQSATQGDVVWLEWEAKVEQTRAAAAKLINAANDEIALVPNTTSGISIVSEGFPWKEGDNVVTPAHEFPSNRYPWMHLKDRGVELRVIDTPAGVVDLDRMAAACDDRTRIVALSWVGYASGYRIDVAKFAEMAHAKGALLFLDAIQGLGVFPLDVQNCGVDFLAADGHKWMLGPEGAGMFFCRKEHLDTLRPACVGWNSVKGRYDFNKIDLSLRPSAARYEGGSQNMVGMIGFGASLKFLQQYGAGPETSAVGERILEFAGEASERLIAAGARVVSPFGNDHASGIVSFEVDGVDPAELRNRCMKAGVVLSHRNGRLRISPHAYNSSEDIDRLLELVANSS